jgi:cytochrome P450
MATRFNPFDSEFVQDPYPVYAALRSEAAVARVRIGPRQMLAIVIALVRIQREQGLSLRDGFRLFRDRRRAQRKWRSTRKLRFRARIYTVSRYDEVAYVLKHPEIFSSEAMGGSEVQVISAEGDIAPTSGSLIAHDPPEHTRQRNIVSRGFTPRRIAELEPKIRKNAEELFARFERRGSCDLMEEFANPLPVSVIADLLGLDPDRRDDFKRWSTALIVGSTQPGRGGGFGNIELFREFRAYMTDVIADRRKNPGDDLISTLIISGEGEEILEPEMVISFASLLLAAGSETTTNLIGNAMLALFQNPAQLERVQGDPSLIDKVITEALRYDSPIQLTARLAMQDSKVAGVSIPRGSMIAVLLASGNRDARQFEDPDRFDIDRPTTPAHLAFGFGNHFCIGASLARLEGSIALEMILTRLRGLSLGVDEVERHGSFLVRGPSTLPLRFDV